MESGGWRVEGGEWRVEGGEWRVEGGGLEEVTSFIEAVEAERVRGR